MRRGTSRRPSPVARSLATRHARVCRLTPPGAHCWLIIMAPAAFNFICLSFNSTLATRDAIPVRVTRPYDRYSSAAARFVNFHCYIRQPFILFHQTLNIEGDIVKLAEESAPADKRGKHELGNRIRVGIVRGKKGFQSPRYGDIARSRGTISKRS